MRVFALALVATLLVASSCIEAETHRFTPTSFYNTYSFAHPPALRIKPGDRVVTKTIDAAGVDAAGTSVASGPNPQTGPFYVEGAEPGDMLVVTIEKLDTNRAMACSQGSLLSPHTVDPGAIAARVDRDARRLTWDDRQGARRGAARSGRGATRRGSSCPLPPDARLHRRRAPRGRKRSRPRRRARSAATWTTPRWAPA